MEVVSPTQPATHLIRRSFSLSLKSILEPVHGPKNFVAEPDADTPNHDEGQGRFQPVGKAEIQKSDRQRGCSGYVPTYQPSGEAFSHRQNHNNHREEKCVEGNFNRKSKLLPSINEFPSAPYDVPVFYCHGLPIKKPPVSWSS
jgi:hypothetical protein